VQITVVAAPATPGVRLDHNVLQITGSSSRDNLSISMSHFKLLISGTLGGTRINQTFYTIGLKQIAANLGDGNDTLQVRANVRIPLMADGGGGNDSLVSGGGSSILVGGGGNDVLVGRARRDLLIRGACGAHTVRRR